MNKKNLKRYTEEELDDMIARGDSKTDWARLDAMTDEDIDYSDIPATDAEFWKDAKVIMPQGKKRVSIEVDRDVLNWFKSRGQDYQSRMSAALRQHIVRQKERVQ